MPQQAIQNRTPSAHPHQTMFKSIRRKLVAATRRKSQRTEVYAVPKPRLDTASDGSPSPKDSRKPLLPKELQIPQGPKPAADRGADVNHLVKSEAIPFPNLDRGEPYGDDVVNDPRPQASNQEIKHDEFLIKPPSHPGDLEEEEDSSKSEAMKFITIRNPSREIQALLLTPLMYQRTRALVHARQDLRATESELATTATEMDNLVSAKKELEEQDDRGVPGAFLDDEAYADRERRQLLRSTIEKKIGSCARALKNLEREKRRFVAGFETRQEQYFKVLERAVRDDASAKMLPLEVEDPGNSAIWWTS